MHYGHLRCRLCRISPSAGFAHRHRTARCRRWRGQCCARRLSSTSRWPGSPWVVTFAWKSCARHRSGSAGSPCSIRERSLTRQRRQDLVRLAQTARTFQPVTRLMLPLLMHPSRQQDESLVQTVSDMAERVGVGIYLRQQQAVMSRPDSRSDLKNVRVPALVLCGRQDALTSLAQHEEMAALIPGAELVIIEDCGHISTLERPDEVSAALRAWLGRI